MGARERTPRTSRADATGASCFFCGKEHLRGGYRRRFGTQRQRTKSIYKNYKTMKNYKIKPEDVAKLIGYTKHTVYKMILWEDEEIILWLKKHKTTRSRYVFGKIKEFQKQVRYRGTGRKRKERINGKTLLERNINDLSREKKQNELFIINEKISRLEADMKAVIFDREINSQLQALYIKRACAMDYLGMKVDAKTEWLL